ncbi:DUF3021 domain-containing protein [Streptobacillus felis]|uniref:DUF3021 domain-containing protein n=1 Tax=Streptobacillus felis TaxID=1384509 RepID=UPI00083508A1|nr:DUF3021 domain-containing protein [Streptobacillus felis]
MYKIIKNIFLNGLIGIGIGTSIAFMFSKDRLLLADPEFISKFPNEMYATKVSLILFAIIGITSGLSSEIYKLENISLYKKTIYHFISTFFTVSSIGYYFGWFKAENFIFFIIIFIIIYLIIWIFSYIYQIKEIERINKKLK